MIVLMNSDFYNSMSEEDKAIFEQTRKESFRPLIDFEMNSYNEALEILKNEGKTLTYPTDDEMAAWKKAVYDIIIPKWKADAKSVGVSEETCDKVLEQWLAIRAKYWKQYNLPGEP
jgi:TRAP-type C4-dicarboxylate transport system substrate-binding protein